MTTRPINHDEIEEVFGEGEAQVPAASLRAEWSRVWAFVKRPALPTGLGAPSPAPFRQLGRIYLLDLCFMFALIGLAIIAVQAGVLIPETALAGIEFNIWVVLGVIVAAPVFEELVFRSWLSGRPGHLLAVLAIGLGAAGAGIAHISGSGFEVPLLAVGVIAAIVALVALRNRPPARWFAKLFPLFFWFSVIAFALVHLSNFDMSSGWSGLAKTLPLVLPQFLLGLLLAYVRVGIGLWAAILLHAAHNATALSFAGLAALTGS